ncbi:unnamed protein product [Danaus chrysippus]|uniref:tRNA (guanine(37)-N1)-methyltransferase n=1 Tax=Danaus chrysippus TaxID=151541 RepID=A0A8J2VWB0_9NEOP|nr:unnamed protein product [Danaus chrysippus]
MNLCFVRNIIYIFKSSSRMSSSSLSSLVPRGVRGMKILDRKNFSRYIKVPILKVSDEYLSKVTQICKAYFLKLENFKPVQNVPGTIENSSKYIYFDPDKVDKWSDIAKEDQTKLDNYDINEKDFDKHEIQLTYDNFKYDQIFKSVLPENEEIVSGFSQIGHIIHLNLREHLLEYSQLIGQVLVDKIKTCRTVVNKSNIIDNTYRNFAMEVIAGDEDFMVTVKENRCNFTFDFSKVYWNPRLCKEHERILELLQSGDVLFDVFCGVGPFAIPAAKYKCRVFANDLNPESFKWLNHNAKINKLNMNNFKSYNIDGKDFLCNNFKTFIIDCCNGTDKLEPKAKIHLTMNLPALAVEFLRHFKGLISENEVKNKLTNDIMVYVYCFATGDDPYLVAKAMVIDNLGENSSKHILDVFKVRNVSPKKEMMRVTLKINDILFQSDAEATSEPPNKKQCLDS